MSSEVNETRDVIKVLHMEPDATCVRLARQMLRKQERVNYRLQQAGSLSQGMGCLEDAVLDVVLMELLLPDCSGIEALFRINQAAPHLAIVVYTEMDEEGMALRAFREGAQDFLTKSETSDLQLSRAVLYARERQRLMNRAGALQKRVVRSERDRAVSEVTRSLATELVPPLTTLHLILEQIGAENRLSSVHRRIELAQRSFRILSDRVRRMKRVYRYVADRDPRGRSRFDLYAASLRS